jgi:NADPH:quinone reductase-like Zn-dependent oxidoreductase
VSHTETASLPLAALTAWQALVDHADMQAGDQVLVTGGAGGVGVYAVQLAAVLGGQVTATGRERDGAFIRALGAHDFTAAGTALSGSFDVIIDTVGGAVLDASYDLLRRGGRLVTLGAPPSQDKAAARGAQATFFIVTPDAAELAQLAGLVDDGRLRAIVSQTFPVSDGRRAFESAFEPRPPGKTVLIVR